MTASQSAKISLQIINAVKADMAAGHVPASVSTFAELHDYVDANEYVIEALEAAGWDLDPASDEQAAVANKAMDMVNVWLGAKR